MGKGFPVCEMMGQGVTALNRKRVEFKSGIRMKFVTVRVVRPGGGLDEVLKQPDLVEGIPAWVGIRRV